MYHSVAISRWWNIAEHSYGNYSHQTLAVQSVKFFLTPGAVCARWICLVLWHRRLLTRNTFPSIVITILSDISMVIIMLQMKYYVGQRDKAHEWKCQPNNWLPRKVRRQIPHKYTNTDTKTQRHTNKKTSNWLPHKVKSSDSMTQSSHVTCDKQKENTENSFLTPVIVIWNETQIQRQRHTQQHVCIHWIMYFPPGWNPRDGSRLVFSHLGLSSLSRLPLVSVCNCIFVILAVQNSSIGDLVPC